MICLVDAISIKPYRSLHGRSEHKSSILSYLCKSEIQPPFSLILKEPHRLAV
jgi:hypothetical protein